MDNCLKIHKLSLSAGLNINLNLKVMAVIQVQMDSLSLVTQLTLYFAFQNQKYLIFPC